MPAYNFLKQFAPAVESFQKRQTIRDSNRGARRGATAYLYYGQRTKQCRKLGEGRLTDVLPIEIGRNANGEPYVYVDPKNLFGQSAWLAYGDLDAFAKADGFASADAFMTFFEAQGSLPLKRWLHVWEPA